MFLPPVVSFLVRVTFSSRCVCPLFSQYIMDLRLILWEIFFDANIKAWISSGCECKKISGHSVVVKKYRVPLTKESVVVIRSPFFSQKCRNICLLGESKLKVKCTLVQALRLCRGHTGRRGSRVIALPSHDHGTRKGWEASVTSRPLFTPGKTRWLGGPQGRSGQVRKISPPTGIRSPDHPTRNQSLYRLRYPAHKHQ